MNSNKILVFLVGLMTLVSAGSFALAQETGVESLTDNQFEWFVENQVTESSSLAVKEQHNTILCFIFGCSQAPTPPAPAPNWCRQQIGETNCTLTRACQISCCDLNIYNSTSEFNSCVTNCVQNTTGPGGPSGCTPI